MPNPSKTWKDINPDLPNTPIRIWGPDATHGARDLIQSHIMLAGCKHLDALKTLETTDPAAFQATCETFRKDGAFDDSANADRA